MVTALVADAVFVTFIGSKEEAVETMNRICITPLASYIFTNNSATKDYGVSLVYSGVQPP